jgi:hypothetical protein
MKLVAALTAWLGILALVAARVAAQEEPDFSGRWVLESAAQDGADVPSALTVRQSLVRTTVRGEPMKPFFKDITVERELKGATRIETYQIGIIGGSVAGLRADGTSTGARTRHSVRWEGRTLVIESGSDTGSGPEGGESAERREGWSLDSQGLLHVAITTRGAGDRSSTIALSYRRQR